MVCMHDTNQHVGTFQARRYHAGIKYQQQSIELHCKPKKVTFLYTSLWKRYFRECEGFRLAAVLLYLQAISPPLGLAGDYISLKLKMSFYKYPSNVRTRPQVRQGSYCGPMSGCPRLIEANCAAQPACKVHLLYFRHLDEGVYL